MCSAPRGDIEQLATAMAVVALLYVAIQLVAQGLLGAALPGDATPLASAAGVIGWWITSVGVRVWADATASPFQVVDDTVNIRTHLYLIAITIVAAFLFSLGPLWHIARLRAGACRVVRRR